MTTISAKTILRSTHVPISGAPVLSTFLLRYPRWIHAEQRTHRVIPLVEDIEFWSEPTPSVMADPALSRNAGSSRAITVEKLIDDILSDPAVPLYFGRNQPGMQAREELSGAALRRAKSQWMRAMHSAIFHARKLAKLGTDDDGNTISAHKQIINRLLEPFSHITVVVSATEWSNFLALRNHEDAEPHIRILAEQIAAELVRTDNIQNLIDGEWHLPFVNEPDRNIDDRIRLSAARCASTSYKTVDGFDMTMERARKLVSKLAHAVPIHASPFEHVAKADTYKHYKGGGIDEVEWDHKEEHGNFVGFRQLRHMQELSGA